MPYELSLSCCIVEYSQSSLYVREKHKSRMSNHRDAFRNRWDVFRKRVVEKQLKINYNRVKFLEE